MKVSSTRKGIIIYQSGHTKSTALGLEITVNLQPEEDQEDKCF
jgi:hypothetical protein